MQSKTIKQILRKKFDEYVKSIKDERVKKLVRNNSIITGGSIASMLLNEDVNDYDVYFTNKETVVAVCDYYINEFKKGNHRGYPSMTVIDTKDRIKIRIKSQGIAREEGFKLHEEPSDAITDPDVNANPEVTPKESGKDPYRPVYISPNAITLADKMQLIIRFYGDAAEIHSNYDFVHCTCQWTSKDGNLVLPSEALECLMARELRYSGSKYPLASIIRTRKFIKRGFHINAGQYLKMCMQLNDLNLRSLEVIEDQLTGVDSAYFAQMLAAIPEDKKIDGSIDSAYLIELINRFF